MKEHSSFIVERATTRGYHIISYDNKKAGGGLFRLRAFVSEIY